MKQSDYKDTAHSQNYRKETNKQPKKKPHTLHHYHNPRIHTCASTHLNTMSGMWSHLFTSKAAETEKKSSACWLIFYLLIFLLDNSRLGRCREYFWNFYGSTAQKQSQNKPTSVLVIGCRDTVCCMLCLCAAMTFFLLSFLLLSEPSIFCSLITIGR